MQPQIDGPGAPSWCCRFAVPSKTSELPRASEPLPKTRKQPGPAQPWKGFSGLLGSAWPGQPCAG